MLLVPNILYEIFQWNFMYLHSSIKNEIFQNYECACDEGYNDSHNVSKTKKNINIRDFIYYTKECYVSSCFLHTKTPSLLICKIYLIVCIRKMRNIFFNI